ncbi:MAG: hypothetical protein FWD13_08420 [Treponema sp.]|nr:hypothetical protein [Treponema sp.]
MASFQFNVDTSPMAHSIDNTRGTLNGVTVAVTAMEAAVIATERQASKTICDKVDEGFYMLVRSQISQKAVAAHTEMTSKQITLIQLAKALENVKRQMENDFHLIAKRYAKLFNSLNKALEIRVKELDRPAMHLADVRKSIVFDKLKDNSSMVFSISNEALPITQTALSGKLKQKTKETMNTLFESVNEDKTYSEKVDSILVKTDNDFSSDANISFIPSAFVVSDSLLNAGDYIENVYTVKTDVWQNTTPIVSEINRVCKDLNWSPSKTEDKNLVRKEFIALCEKDSTDGRILKEMIRLFDESAWEDCK